MDKSILREFATESRKDLMDRIKLKLSLYFIEESFDAIENGDMIILKNKNTTLNLTREENKKRDLLIKRTKEIGIEKVIEEAAYTWFNRLIAIRYMELHDFLPLGKNNESLGIRVLSSNDNTPNPEIMKFSNLINNQLDINFYQDKYANINNENEKFKYLLQLVCNKLKKVFPDVFGGNTDYIDLLMPENMLSETGFISKMIKNIPVENFDKVEIIGWLYQYYNQTEKDYSMSNSKHYKKEEIPYVTQLFTPDWIVKYMVENSLGKYYIEHDGNPDIKKDWKYFIDSLSKKKERINLDEIKIIDPCCGSGHILVYIFEVLYNIYVYEGYNRNDIAELILKNNIYGLDIDDRAGQLSILSLLLKAREYDSKLFSKTICSELNVMSLKEPSSDLYNISNDENLSDDIKYLYDSFTNIKEIGSLVKIDKKDYSNSLSKLGDNLFDMMIKNQLAPLLKQESILTNKYNVVITNPPYMGANRMGDNLKKYLNSNYPDSKTDLCTAFMEIDILKDDGYIAMINQQAWMFLGSFEKLRKKILSNFNFSSMLHLGMGTFGADFGTTTFVMSKEKCDESKFFRLVNEKTSELKEQDFLNKLKANSYYGTNNEKFKKIVGYPIAYWVSDSIIKAFENNLLMDLAGTKQGLATGDNDKFLRLWWEVDYDNIKFDAHNSAEAIASNKKWFPCNKGGEFRKWYGNNYRLVNWYNDGEELKKFKGSVLRNVDTYFKEGLTWSSMTSSSLSMRFSEYGKIYESKGSMCFVNDSKNIFYILGLLNSKVVNELLLILSPTLDYHEGPMGKVPIIIDNEKFEEVTKLVKENIELVKKDWNTHEYSYNFEFNVCKNTLLENEFSRLDYEKKQDIERLKNNEELLNKIFIEIYDLNKDITPEVPENEISIKSLNEDEFVKSIISYSVGCMFGRYKFEESFIDEDNILPISDSMEIYYDDDIVGKFKEFIKLYFGENNYESNMEYITKIIGRKGTESYDDTLRKYFINNFYNDHKKLFNNLPIYWLLNSGDKNGFKCLTYIHNYNNQLLSKIRVDYLHKVQNIYERLKNDINQKIENGNNINENRTLLNNIILKLDECNLFDEKIGHLANQMIDIDLDDGIKSNYEKFADILAKIK